jgi:hypothetical protein
VIALQGIFIHVIYTKAQAGYNHYMEGKKEVEKTSRIDIERVKRTAKIVWTILVYIFAAIGFFLTVSYFVIRFGFSNTSGIIDLQRESFLGAAASTTASQAAINQTPEYPNGTPWQDTEEWTVLSAAISKDTTALNQASAASGVPARLILMNLVVEQLRLFFTERGYFKQFFAPLQILGAQTQFSLGVMGMKDNTAAEVEENLKNPSSPFYPGDAYAHLLDYSTASSSDANSNTLSATSSAITQLRYVRLTDQHNHYYSYLYAGLYIKEIEAQWEKAGFPINNRPDILGTLYNIGFEHSLPNANPQVGGAAITINGVTYSFGGLALQFYNSDLLTNLFPKQ